MQNASDTKSIIVYLLAFQCLHWVSFTRCNFASVSTRHTWEVLSVWKKVFSHQIRWLWFQHDVNRSFRQSNQTGYKNFKRSLRIDFFFFVPHAAPILFHKKEQQSDRLCFSEPLTKRANGRKKMAQSRR